MPDGRKGWDRAWAEACTAGQVCVSALRRSGFRVGKDGGKGLEEALAELFLPALRMPLAPSGRDRACGHAGSPHSADLTRGGGQGQDQGGSSLQGRADPQETR